MRTLIFCALLITIQCELPPNFKTCNRKDPNFKKCYLEAAQHGLRQMTKPYRVFATPNIEPLDVPILTIKGGEGAVAVDQNFRDCKLGGLTAMKFERFELDLEKDTLDVVGTSPALSFNCHYNLDGKVLLLPVQGDGSSEVIMKDFGVIYHAQYEKYKKGKKTYYKTTDTALNASLSHIHFQFNNLFNGNKQLGDNINVVINENWQQVYEDIRPQYTEVIKRVLDGMIQKLWDNVSLEEYFDN